MVGLSWGVTFNRRERERERERDYSLVDRKVLYAQHSVCIRHRKTHLLIARNT